MYSLTGRLPLLRWAVQQFAREGKPLPPDAAVDAEAILTTDAKKAKALLPFGAHKGYRLSLINELVGAFIGGSLPTIRGHHADDDESKPLVSIFRSSTLRRYRRCQMSAQGRDQISNVKAVLSDILQSGNENCLLPVRLKLILLSARRLQEDFSLTKRKLRRLMKSLTSAGNLNGI